MKVSKCRLALMAGTCVVALFTAPATMAQTSAGSARDQQAEAASQASDIVVTARRTRESALDVPLAITAIGTQQLEDANVADLKGLAELAPQVMIGEFGTGTGAILTIRGVSSDAIDSGLDQSVLVVVDGVPMSVGSVVRQGLFDVEQVEVMPGPQALYFGKNSSAGVISLRTTGPSDRLEGFVSAGYEFEARQRYAEAAISGPLSDTFGARIAGRVSAMDGWIRNVAQPMESPFHPGVFLPGNVNKTSPNSSDYSGRLTLKWSPSTDFDAEFKATYDHQGMKGNGNLAFHEAWCYNNAAAPTTLGRPQVGADCRKDRRVAVSANPAQYAVNFPLANGGIPYQDNNSVLLSLNLEKRFGDVSLNSTTGYYDHDHKGSNCSDGAYCELFSTDARKFKQFSQELRLSTDLSGPLNFMGGGYYEHSKRYWFTAVDFNHAGIDPTTNSYASWMNQADGIYEGYSVFGQVRWKLLPNLELAGGARYSKDRKRSDIVNLEVSPFATLPLYPEGQVLKVRTDDDNISPEVTLTWHPQADQTLYAAYRTGYKSGGISNPSIFFATDTTGTLGFEAEKARGFEVGYKGVLANGALRLNLSAYRYDFRNLQVVSYDVTAFAFKIGNAAKSRTQGVEGSFVWNVDRQLSLNGNFGYNDAKFRDYRGAQCWAGQTVAEGCVGGQQDLSGKRTMRSPKLTASLGGAYESEVGSGWLARLSTNLAYSSSYNAMSNNSPGGVQPAFWRLNAAFSLMPENERIKLSVTGRNLTNSYYLIAASNLPFGSANDFVGTFARPREVAVELRYNF
jgi:outer membrane receptor protein involved in Fe transport